MFEDINIPPASLERADIAAQILCSQIASDVRRFVKQNVISSLPKNKALGWRENRMLSQLHSHRGGLTSAHMSELTRYSAPTISRLNLKLLHSGFITLEEHHYDARSTLLKITPSGISHMESLYAACNAQQDRVVPELLPELDDAMIRHVADICLSLQRRAETLAGLDTSGRMRGYQTTQHSKSRFDTHFKEFTRFPELLFQKYCARIASDYMTFFNRHAIKPLGAVPKIKIRELRVLMCLESFGEASTSVRMAKEMRFDKATIARATAALTDGGYIAAETSDIDDRAKPFWLTEKGLKAARDYKAKSSAALQRADQITGASQDKETARRSLAALLMLRNRTCVFAKVRPLRQRAALKSAR